MWRLAPRHAGRAPEGARAPHSRATAPRASSGLQQQQQPRRVVESDLAGRARRRLQLGGGGGGSGGASAGGEPAEAAASPLAAVRAFFLPRGWPGSVTPDYLAYQLATVPAHITGHCSHALATSSMIQALGISAGPAAAVATSAAIKWITKDGLGAAGRLIVGSSLAQVFDEDPRRWRMVAEGISTLGLSMEIATQMFPAQFVALAGAGTLAKSMAKGMGRPCFRVIQTHFSATNNVGDVAAKEEVWEVAAQLAGLASSVALLQLLQSAGTPELAIPAWAAVHGVHVGLRYTALAALRFPYPNQKRAAQLVSAHMAGLPLPSIEEANAAESLLLPPSACRPSVTFGCTLEEALAGLDCGHAFSSGSSSSSSSQAAGAAGEAAQAALLGELLQLYGGERYVLTWADGAARVLLLEGARPMDLLRAMWQAAWLDHTARGSANGSSANGNGACPPSGERLAASLAALRESWPGFVSEAEGLGWQLDKAVLPRGRALLRVE